MDYQKVTVIKLDTKSINQKLLYDIAVLFAKTGFYEQSIRIRNNGIDPFERIIEKFILPDLDNINIILYDGEFVGFYLAHLIHNMIPRELSAIPPFEKINWSNHGNVIYNFYDVYFNNGEFLIDNMALKSQFQGKGIYSNIIFPTLLKSAKELNATNLVAAVLRYKSHDAYTLCLNRGCRQIANLKFQLDEVRLFHDQVIEKTTEELILFRLPI